jgi:parallel beta-helix repeat protein
MNALTPINLHKVYIEVANQSLRVNFFFPAVIALAFGFLSSTSYATVVGNGTAASCTDAALNQAIANGGTITFKCGGSAKTITLGSEKLITVNTIIDGGNKVTISGSGNKRLFKVNPSTSFSVKNLTLTNGYATGPGGAIHAASWPDTKVYVTNCKFINNVAKKPGESGGGAIVSSGGYLTVSKSTFTGNKAGVGGAIRVVQSNLTVNSSTFTGNKATEPTLGDGGAIHIDGGKTDNGKILIQNSVFKSNSASNYGGAVFNNILNNNTTYIANSTFSGNMVGAGGVNGQGGAIWSTGEARKGGQWISNVNNTKLTLSNCTVSGNTASKMGGGIFIARHLIGTIIDRSTFSGNTSLTSMGGGIVQAENGNLTMVNSTITNNKAIGQYSMGGGIYIGKSANAYLTNVTISDNLANWQGGGIFGQKNVTLKNSILANNVALNGGNSWNIKHNCFEPMSNGGHNLQYPDPTDADCTVGILIADPLLGSLRNNGGANFTRALLNGSAASRNGANCPKIDQRGISRSLPAGTWCDVGAYEAPF